MVVSKKFFPALWASVWSNNKGGQGFQPPPGSATEQGCALVEPADLRCLTLALKQLGNLSF